MNIANHLLPCPFCNSRSLDVDSSPTRYVICKKCGTWGPDADAEKGVSAIDAWNNRTNAALAAEPVGEEEVSLELMAALVEIQRLRDLCHHPAAPPAPEAGEVEGLVDRLGWIAAQLGDIGWSDDSASVTRAATLLQQQAAPAPVVVGECPHCGYEGEMARVPHPSAPG